MILTLFVIVLGGGLFITTFNLRAALIRTVGNAFQARNYDLTFQLTNLTKLEELRGVLDTVPGVKAYDFWIEDKLRIRTIEGREGDELTYYAIPAKSEFLKMEILQGTWIRADEPRGIVINHGMAKTKPGFEVGKTVELKIGSRWSRWKVIGIVKEVMSSPKVYFDYESFIRFHDYPEVTDEIQVRVPGRMISTGFTLHGIQFGSTKREVSFLELDDTAASLEREFENAGIDVYASWKVAEMKKSVDDHMKVASMYIVAWD